MTRSDDKMKGRKGDADSIGQMSPAAGAEALRESVLEIVELDLDGHFSAPSLQHFCGFPAHFKQRLYHRCAASRRIMERLLNQTFFLVIADRARMQRHPASHHSGCAFVIPSC